MKCPLLKSSIVDGYKRLNNPNPNFAHRSNAGIIYEEFLDCIKEKCMAWNEEKKICNYFNQNQIIEIKLLKKAKEQRHD